MDGGRDTRQAPPNLCLPHTPPTNFTNFCLSAKERPIVPDVDKIPMIFNSPIVSFRGTRDSDRLLGTCRSRALCSATIFRRLSNLIDVICKYGHAVDARTGVAEAR